MTTVPVLVSSNPIDCWWLRNEFGNIAFVVAESFSDAWDEACEYVADRDGECDHGGDKDVLRAIRDTGEATGCDCDMTDDGRYVWMVHHSLKGSALNGEQFFLTYGDDVERIPIRSEAIN